MQTILVTGLSGIIGSAVRTRLDGRYNLRALNRRDVPGVPTVQADIADLGAIRPAFEGVDAVVHLSAAGGGDDQWDTLYRTNVLGTYNVFEAARLAGVTRVVYASSSSVTGGLERDDPYKALLAGRYDDVTPPWPRISHESPVRPRSLYGVTKATGETLARYYADFHGMSMVCLRFGHVTREDVPAHLPNDYSIWCSGRDAAQMVELALQAPPELRFDIFYVTSDNPWGIRDIEHGRRVLGFAPQDSAESYRPAEGRNA
jgi:nucleoside-diphosphate-sugar epimerase